MSIIKLGLALRTDNKREKQAVEESFSLLKLEWTILVSKLAHFKLHDLKVNKPPSSLPIPKESVIG